MADTKLTREWVENELATFERHLYLDGHSLSFDAKQHLENRAALCRHYLATEQVRLLPERWREAYQNGASPIWHRCANELDAALTQKEPQT